MEYLKHSVDAAVVITATTAVSDAYCIVIVIVDFNLLRKPEFLVGIVLNWFCPGFSAH